MITKIEIRDAKRMANAKQNTLWEKRQLIRLFVKLNGKSLIVPTDQSPELEKAYQTAKNYFKDKNLIA